MKQAYNKDSKRMFKNNLGRFISIVLIIMLGVAFFVGMNEVSPVMKQTAEEYMKEHNIYDYNLVSNLGYNDEDIEKLKEIDNITEVQGVYSYDALTSFGEKDIAIRALSNDNEDTLNEIYLSEGRNIENDDECLINIKLKDMYDYQIGQTIKLYRKDDTNIDDSLKCTEFKIVGIAKKPIYLSRFHGNTTLLTGDLNGYIIVNKEVFDLDAYTEVYIKADIDENISKFSDEYNEKNDEITNEIKKENDSIIKEKYDKIFNESAEKIKTQEEKINQMEHLLQEKKDEIKNSQLQVNNSIVDILQGVAYFYKTESIYSKAIERQTSIETLYSELNQLESEKNDLEDTNIDLKNEVLDLEEQIEEINNNIEKNLYELYSLDNEATKFVSINKDNNKLYFDYNNLENQYKKIKTVYEKKQDDLKNIKELIDNKNVMLQSIQNELYVSLESQKDLIDGMGDVYVLQGYNVIEETKVKIEDAENTLKEHDIEGVLIEAKEEIRNSKDELNKFEMIAETIPLYKNNGFKALKEDLDKIAIMGRIFPVMFFVIAALVTITTVTRMIETDRKDIGTLKALGYQNEIIIRRYVLYALCAGIIGTILGCLVGSLVIVEILFVSYSSLYDLPNLVTRVKLKYMLMALGVSLISTIFVAWVVTRKELKDNAAELMRPKTGTTGKTILLERIHFIWNKLDFLYKICFRNIFRYKKRLFMTLIGIAGCTALIYAGLGLQSAVNSISNKQFQTIRTFSMEIYLSEELKQKEVADVIENVLSQQYVEKATPVRQQAVTIQAKGLSKEIFYIILDKDAIDEHMKLKDRKTQEKIELNDEGVVLTEKLANILNISKGEKIDLIDGDVRATITVIGITENYMYNYIYFTPEVYERLYGSEIKYNELFVNVDDNINDDKIIVLSDQIKQYDKISSIALNKNIEKDFKTSLGSLMSIVFLFLFSASALSFTVLINLNNINIEERKREISTLELLGFYPKELESYIFRENVILTILGTIIGLIIGMGILGIIIKAAEVETIFLVKEINYIAMVISVIITLAFTLITNLLMKKKIKNIDMVESLKSIE